jgi:ribulose-phosphate 3-epimerase
MRLIWSSPLPNERPYVAPSLLSADFSCLGDEIAAVERGGADWLHVDVMDAQFVPALTLGPVVLRGIRKLTGLYLDTHLMVHEPARLLHAFRAAGADGITVHVEASADVGAALEAVRATGARVGLSLSPDTAFARVEPWLDRIDLLLVMTVVPGRGGQAFMPAMLAKVEAAARARSRGAGRFAIEVDGGIDPETAPAARRAGADVLVAGTAIFARPPYAERIAALKAAGVAPTP